MWLQFPAFLGWSFSCPGLAARYLPPSFFFFNDTATTEIYTLSLHDALPICLMPCRWPPTLRCATTRRWTGDRKSTRLNSSHQIISYAVFCLKKKRLCWVSLLSV